jgi:hypothetical protein
MQRMLKIEGLIAPCQGCGKQPRHWHEAIQGGQHFLECSPCNTRTPKFSTFQAAVESWERNDVAAVKIAA